MYRICEWLVLKLSLIILTGNLFLFALCSALIFAGDWIKIMKFLLQKSCHLGLFELAIGSTIRLPFPMKNRFGLINLIEGGIFGLLVIWNSVQFLGGDTLQERAELSYKTPVLVLKIIFFLSNFLISNVIINYIFLFYNYIKQKLSLN
jgi:hypothetical protein